MQARGQAPGKEQDRAGSTSGWDTELGARPSGGPAVGSTSEQGSLGERVRTELGARQGPTALGSPSTTGDDGGSGAVGSEGRVPCWQDPGW